MEQQNKQEEKNVKIFHVENILRNRYGLKQQLASVLSSFIVDFSENIFENYDYEKVKHIRNAQSSIGMVAPPLDLQTKIVFYVGLMNKDDFSYKFSKQDAIAKIVAILGDCTIQEAIGIFTRNDGKKIQTDTLIATKFINEYDGNFVHYKAKELKKIFNQSSILTEEFGHCSVKYNDESKELEKKIEDLMQEYEWTWSMAKDAYESGLL